MLKTLGVLGSVVVAGGAVSKLILFNVDGGEAAIMFHRFRGVLDKVYREGSHFYVPWLHTPHIYDIKTSPKSITVNTGSKDLQTVNITLRILVRPFDVELPNIYRRYGEDYSSRILPSITTEVLKSIVAQYNAGELITQRELVSSKVSENLTERARYFGLILDDISITHLGFGFEFMQAVEAKQVAQQEAEKARFLVEKAEQQKQAAIIRSEGDSAAADLLGKAFKGSGNALIEFRRIEAAEEIARNLSKNANVAFLPQGSNNLLQIPRP